MDFQLFHKNEFNTQTDNEKYDKSVTVAEIEALYDYLLNTHFFLKQGNQ